MLPATANIAHQFLLALLLLLAPVVSTAAGVTFLTSGGGGDSTSVNALTNGAALGATALQPSWAATGTVATALTAGTAGYADQAASATTAGAADRAAVADTADYALMAGAAGDAYTLVDWSADGQALDALIGHTNDPSAHLDIRAAIDAIPLPPTNAVAGWLVWDSGSNCYWQVTATNLRFYVWGVAE